MRLVGVAVVVVTTIVYSQQCWAQQLPSFLGPSGSGLGGPFGRRGNLTDFAPPLIPIEELYSDPQYDNVLISPSGRYFSYLSLSNTTGHLNVFVQDLLQLKPAVQVTDAPNDITSGNYAWSRDEQFILWVQNIRTGQNLGPGSHLYRTLISPPGGTVDLTPQLPPYTVLVDFTTGAGNPNFVALELVIPNITRGADPAQGAFPNIYLADIDNPGNLSQITQNPGNVDLWVLDRSLFVRAAKVAVGEGSWVLKTRMSPTSPWVDVFNWTDADPSGPLMGGDVAMSFNANGSSMYLLSSKGFDTMHLLQINTATGDLENDLAHSKKSDVVGVVFNPSTYSIDAVSFDYLRRQWVALNPIINNQLQMLQTYFNGSADYDVISASDDGSIWSVIRTRDNGPTEWYIFNTATRRTTFLFADKPGLYKYQLAKSQGVVIPTPDGLEMPTYLWLPVLPPDAMGRMPGVVGAGTPGVGAKSALASFPLRLPLIVVPHPGPGLRDQFGFQPLIQLFTNRGYAVIQPQYRGSTGFGKQYTNAGDGQWGLKMQDDLVTAVQWTVDNDLVDPARVAIYGLQYGGYAALMGLTRNPEVFTCCAAALSPIANVSYIIDTFPAFANTSGLNDTAGMDQLISPIYHLANVTSPLLLGEGSLNDRMVVATTLAISAALDYRNIPNELYVYSNEFNGITKEPNRIDFASRLEQFFGKYLGGRTMPPVTAPNSTVHVVNATQMLTTGAPAGPGTPENSVVKGGIAAMAPSTAPQGPAASALAQGPAAPALTAVRQGIGYPVVMGPSVGTGPADQSLGPYEDTSSTVASGPAMVGPGYADAMGPSMGTGPADQSLGPYEDTSSTDPAAEGPGYTDAAGPSVDTGDTLAALLGSAAANGPSAADALPGLDAGLPDVSGAGGLGVAEGPASGTGYPTSVAQGPDVPSRLPALLDPSRYEGLGNLPNPPQPSQGDLAGSPGDSITNMLADTFLSNAGGPQAAAPGPALGI